MKKKVISVLLSTVLLMGMAGCGNAQQTANSASKTNTSETGSAQTGQKQQADAGQSAGAADDSLYAADAVLKLWGSQDDQIYLQEAIRMFQEEYSEASGWTIETAVISSADAKDEVLKDPAACIGSDLYGFPSTSNSYFMYYDKSLYTEEEIKSLDTMLAKDLGKVTNFAMDLDNGWYMASFFFGAGCTLFGEDGQDPTECSFNNEGGIQAGNYILGLTQNPKVGNYDDTLLLSGFADRTLGATITGTWNAEAIEESLGADFGVATFPTVTYGDGSVVQPSPIVNFNIYGVNAQTKYPLEAMLLANYLTSEKIQEMRFAERNSTPVNKNLVSNKELLAASPAVATLAAQTELASTVQSSIPQIANFWSPMEAFGQDCIAGVVSEEGMQDVLDVLVQSILATIG